ncbi:differentially expressed in FDCP 6 homolog [Schistocerca cancellata]|uniref:differentially expressed in FDCP 6 homolog n=1 Tax=Schistocerca cancellata TaxID=274614 RepID=UPI002118505C|nr:differentially expressed in FDCP 6 homolog [Schistocerca cancellata]
MKAMSVILKNVMNSIWHAFNALTSDKSGVVVKSRLKVLTANIGTLLDLYGVEKGLEHYRSTKCLNFGHYSYYLQREVFSSLPDNISIAALRDYEEKIDEVCWLVCKKHYLSREHPVFSDVCVYKLFRIFCLLADLIPQTEEIYQVLLHTSECASVASQFVTSLGLQWDASDFESLAAVIGSFRFPTFLAIMETKYSGAGKTDQAGVEEAVHEMYQTFLYDVLKKGMLYKRGYLLPTLKEYWFVLHPTELSYFKSQNEREQCGSIPLDPQCRVDVSPQTNSNSTRDRTRFVLNTNDRTFEFATMDHRTRLQWISSLQTAISYSGLREGYQRSQANRRRRLRDAEILKISEENRRRTSQIIDMEQTRAELQAEKMARLAAETQAKELEEIHKEEERRLQELEDVRRRLEKLLEEETQAKRDEEIVRNLQARVLREEWEKREELEQLQEEQRLLLEQEREKRIEFEKKQRDKELQLQEAIDRLRQLEEERLQLDQELNIARDKILLSEQSKEVLEAKLRVISPQIREPDRIRRALSFMPSTKERPTHIQVRGAKSFRSKGQQNADS